MLTIADKEGREVKQMLTIVVKERLGVKQLLLITDNWRTGAAFTNSSTLSKPIESFIIYISGIFFFKFQTK